MLIQRSQKKGGEVGKENEGVLQSRLMEEGGLAPFVPVISSGSGPRAEQLVLKMHVSSSNWAASFGISACQGTQMLCTT